MQQAVRTEGRDWLRCRACDAVFPEGRATTDGWHYACPDCGESGLGDGLKRIER
ncbi:HVO_2901 family zinc finger protein [Halarchaeum sp. P4]|uniref:HVO_2901 family zinc finger protein n=1 Tax=Halarchaeum sp. P4 TaxID=3421639 RepID=UPI003EBD2D16